MEWNNLSSVLDNGRSKPVNTVLGALGGLVAGGQSRGTYYPQSNWMGGGLARTSLGYIPNQNYVSPYGFGEAMGEALRRGDKDQGGFKFNIGDRVGGFGQNLLARLSGIRKNYDNPFHRGWEYLVDKRNSNRGGDLSQGYRVNDPYGDLAYLT